MRQRIDPPQLWGKAARLANQQLSDDGELGVPQDLPCPFTLDDLLAPDFAPADAGARIEETIAAYSR